MAHTGRENDCITIPSKSSFLLGPLPLVKCLVIKGGGQNIIKIVAADQQDCLRVMYKSERELRGDTESKHCIQDHH